MKPGQFIFLPLFLCCTILFRITFLSYGLVQMSPKGHPKTIGAKEKFLEVSEYNKQEIAGKETNKGFKAVFKFAKNKCVLGKASKLTLTGFFNILLSIVQSPTSKEHCDPTSKIAGFFVRRHLALSVIRI